MKRSSRYALRTVGVFAILFAVAGVGYIFSADSRVAGSVVARPLEWFAPVVAASVIIGVSWVLLDQQRPDDSNTASFDRKRCPACGREVLGQWRMCPYCGGMLDRPPVLTESGTTDR